MRAAGSSESQADKGKRNHRELTGRLRGPWETREERSKEGPFRELWPCQPRARWGQIAPFCNQRLKSKFSSERLVPASFKTWCRPNQTHLRSMASPANGQRAAPAGRAPSRSSVQFYGALGGDRGHSRSTMKYPTLPASTRTPFST